MEEMIEAEREKTIKGGNMTEKVEYKDGIQEQGKRRKKIERIDNRRRRIDGKRKNI